MEAKKIIAVVGATGAQGGGLVRAILADPSGGFAVRAITRDVGTAQAKALAKQGADVVAGDVDDEASLERALKGAYGAYFVTFFWAHFSPEREMTNARAMAQAAKAAGLQHVIWSTLEDTRAWVPLSDNRMPTLLGSYKVPHFDAKGASNKFFTDLGLPVTLLLTSFYWDNFINFGMGPTVGKDGQLALTLPMADKKLPGIAAGDIGGCKTVGIAGEHLTGQQMADAFTRALGQKVVYNAVTPEAYRGFGFPGAEDLGNMFQFKQEFESYYCGARDLALSRALNPKLQTFDQWLHAHARETLGKAA